MTFRSLSPLWGAPLECGRLVATMKEEREKIFFYDFRARTSFSRATMLLELFLKPIEDFRSKLDFNRFIHDCVH